MHGTLQYSYSCNVRRHILRHIQPFYIRDFVHGASEVQFHTLKLGGSRFLRNVGAYLTTQPHILYDSNHKAYFPIALQMSLGPPTNFIFMKNLLGKAQYCPHTYPLHT